MSYPDYVKSRAPQINLPYQRTINPIIYDFYDIDETDEVTKYTATCKECVCFKRKSYCLFIYIQLNCSFKEAQYPME